MKAISIQGRRVGEGHPCFIIAEAGVNHNGSLDLAKQLVDAAVWARADAVKFQSFKTEKLVTRTAAKAAYQNAAGGAEESQFDLLKRLELSEKDQRALAAYCRRKRILFLSSPFDEDSADFLERLKVPAFKLGSGELTNLPLLRHVAQKGLPLIVSTGMAKLEEVRQAVRVIQRTGNRHLVLLHCVSNYPVDPALVNLRALQTLKKVFHVPAGYSDHTRGIEVAIGAAALGACVIEKHLTLDRTLPGPDQRASIEPKELAAMVYAIRVVQLALGDGRKRPAACEQDVARAARKSLVSAVAISKGSRLQRRQVVMRRPGTGLPPAQLPVLLGRVARRDLPAERILRRSDFT